MKTSELIAKLQELMEGFGDTVIDIRADGISSFVGVKEYIEESDTLVVCDTNNGLPIKHSFVLIRI